MKKHFFKSLILISSSIFFIFYINYFIDPYAVFRKKYESRKTPANEYYLKTKYILENPNKYNSYIFGSSRVGTLKGENLNFGKFYNMTFSGALLAEILKTLEIFEEKEVEIKNIILGIDDFDLYITPESQEEVMYKLSYEKLTRTPFSLYKNYILTNPFNKVTYEYFFGNKISNVDILDTGKWSLPIKEVEIENNPTKHRGDKIFEISHSSQSEKPRLQKTISEVKKIIEICERREINLTVIFLPIHKTTYEGNNLENLNSFKKELSKITDYWDFLELNEFTEDNYYWYEASHYRPLLGELILKKIFKENFLISPKIVDEKNVFGKFIKKTNN
ncbi:MAG: hypothetical protein RR904_06580 [Bacilli bacterium]